MKLRQTLLIATMALFAASGLMAKNQPKKEEVPGVAPQPAEFFYTGKPYDSDLGAFTFNFRNYDPEFKRWTSMDPSGFPDGANNQIYAPTPTSQFDPTGLDTQSISPITYCFVIPYVGSAEAGSWSGTFVYSFVHNQETSSITPTNPAQGFTGFTGISLTTTIGGATVGIGCTITANYTNNSTYNTKTVGGVQWKQYEVNMTVDIVKSLVIGGQIASASLGSATIDKKGDWYYE